MFAEVSTYFESFTVSQSSTLFVKHFSSMYTSTVCLTLISELQQQDSEIDFLCDFSCTVALNF